LDTLFLDRPLLSDRFCVGDVLEPECVDKVPALKKFVTSSGGVHVAYVGAVFHLLNERDCVRLAQALFRLLTPGGVTFGRTVGLASVQDAAALADAAAAPPTQRFLHSPASMTALLESVGFTSVQIHEEGHDNSARRGTRERSTARFRSAHGDLPGGNLAHLGFFAVKPDNSA